MGIFRVDLNNIDLDDVNFYEDDPEAISLGLIAWRNRLRQCEAFKKGISKELMLLAWHPTIP